MKVKDIWGMEKGHSIVLQFNQLGQPIGDGGGIVAGFLGSLGALVMWLPISYRDWKVFPKTIKDKCYNEMLKVI
jgi:hypothetical protein